MHGIDIFSVVYYRSQDLQLFLSVDEKNVVKFPARGRHGHTLCQHEIPHPGMKAQELYSNSKLDGTYVVFNIVPFTGKHLVKI